MGIAVADIDLIQSDDLALERADYLTGNQVRLIMVPDLIDAGALMLAILKSLVCPLDFRKVDEALTALVNGETMRADADVVGPVEIRCQNHRTVVEAIAIAAETKVLRGAIPNTGNGRGSCSPERAFDRQARQS
jgi:hypothetical protein